MSEEHFNKKCFPKYGLIYLKQQQKKSLMGKVLQSAQSKLTTLVDFCRTALTARLYVLYRSFNTFSLAKCTTITNGRNYVGMKKYFCHAHVENV